LKSTGSPAAFSLLADFALSHRESAATSAHAHNATSRQAFATFLEVLDDDAREAGAALRLVLAQPGFPE
jgi:hypothetical protein